MNQFLEKEQTHKQKDRNSAGTMDWQAKVIFFWISTLRGFKNMTHEQTIN